MLIGAVGTAVCLAGVAAIFATKQRHDLLIWLLVAYIAFFAFSQGAVIWVYISEVFPNRVRAKGQSLGSFTHWIMNAIDLRSFSGAGGQVEVDSVRFLRRHDGAAVLRGVVHVPGDERRVARRHAEKADGRVIGFERRCVLPPLRGASLHSERGRDGLLVLAGFGDGRFFVHGEKFVVAHHHASADDDRFDVGTL